MKTSRVVVLLSVSLVMFFSFVFLASADDVMTVEANIFAYVASVEVPESVFLGNLTKGYETELNSSNKIYINNTGTMGITVTPELVNSSEIIFSYLYFNRILSGDFERIGNYSLDIDQPSEPGGKEVGSFYMKLDLRNFNESIEEDMLGHNAEVNFIAMPQ
tara:strand:+ start:745 stop:1227 length:483 start_codon:yes stop_codon:yes gene_type:complete